MQKRLLEEVLRLTGEAFSVVFVSTLALTLFFSAFLFLFYHTRICTCDFGYQNIQVAVVQLGKSKRPPVLSLVVYWLEPLLYLSHSTSNSSYIRRCMNQSRVQAILKKIQVENPP